MVGKDMPPSIDAYARSGMIKRIELEAAGLRSTDAPAPWDCPSASRSGWRTTSSSRM